MASPTIYWYDFETFGRDPRRDRASQFAGIRTDEQLNIIGEPLVMYCQPADDFLPSPTSCLITGITPQKALAEGVPEIEFITRILQEFSQPETCVAGYNNIRFDDEVTRQLLYRNLLDPYEREWKNGNSRWDIIDMVRLCAATRAEGINWPKKDDGSNSFRLDQLTVANDIEHSDAHDALADVIATIEMAKLIRDKQPRLFEYVYRLRGKKKVQAEIDLNTGKPVLHVSVMYPARLGCLALVMPICIHPTNNNAVIVYDLREDPRSWADLNVEQIRERIYTPADKLPEGVRRVPLKMIHTNKCPVVTSPAVLDSERAALYEIDLDRCKQHWELLRADSRLRSKVSSVFREEHKGEETDPDFMIYSGGFFSDYDRELMRTVHAARPGDMGRLDLPFRDRRLKEMLFRYRARNHADTLSEQETASWNRFRAARLSDAGSVERYRQEMEEAQERATAADRAVLESLQEWVDNLTASLPA